MEKCVFRDQGCFLGSFLSCVRYELCAHWTFVARIRARIAYGLLLLLPSRVLRLVHGQSFMKLFEDLQFDLELALLTFRHFQELDCSESSWVGFLTQFYWLRTSLNRLNLLRCSAKNKVQMGRCMPSKKLPEFTLLGSRKTSFIIATP